MCVLLSPLTRVSNQIYIYTNLHEYIHDTCQGTRGPLLLAPCKLWRTLARTHALTRSHALTHTQEDRATRKAVGIVQQSLVEAQERAKQEQALVQLQEEALDHRALVQVSPSLSLSLPLSTFNCCG